MTISELNSYFSTLPDKILPDIADIIAETATEYFKESFTRKAFDGNPWAPGRPKRTGSLLIDSGNLLNSIHPAIVSPERVVISAGNDKVTYAAVHNEGYTGPVSVPAHQRTVKRTGTTYNVRPHTRNVSIPQRQFIGDSSELNTMIHNRIEGYLDSLLDT